VIAIRNVTKEFDVNKQKVTALSDVNFTIEKGDIFGIIGFSGAGKSTLLRMINALEVPTSGHVEIDGVNINGLSFNELRKVRKRIGMVFQSYELFPHLTVLENILLAPTKIYVKPVLKVLEEVDVKGISHITGGGFYENIPRSLKKGCCARINKADVRTPALFQLMQKTGNISEHDMFNTFNMGVGMVLTVPAEQADKALDILHANGEPEAYRLGVIAEGEGVELC